MQTLYKQNSDPAETENDNRGKQMDLDDDHNQEELLVNNAEIIYDMILVALIDETSVLPIASNSSNHFYIEIHSLVWSPSCVNTK